MRVILKPGGIAVVIFSLASLAGAVAYSVLRVPGDTAVTNAAKPAAPARAGIVGGGATVMDGDFSGAFAPARFYGNSAVSKTVLTGEIADGWADNSDWADVTVRYARAVGPDGNACQRMDVDAVRGGRAQFVQLLNLVPGTPYRASVRLKSEASTVATFTVHPNDSVAETNTPSKDVALAPVWQTVEVRFTAKTQAHLFMIACAQPKSVLYIDDSKIEPVAPAASNPQP